MEDVCETGGKKGVKGTLVGRKVEHESNTYCGTISISCCALELWFYTHHSHLTYPQSSQHTCSGEVVSLCENDFSVCGRRGRMHVCVCVCVCGGGGGGLVLVTISTTTTCRIKKGSGERGKGREGWRGKSRGAKGRSGLKDKL